MKGMVGYCNLMKIRDNRHIVLLIQHIQMLLNVSIESILNRLWKFSHMKMMLLSLKLWGITETKYLLENHAQHEISQYTTVYLKDRIHAAKLNFRSKTPLPTTWQNITLTRLFPTIFLGFTVTKWYDCANMISPANLLFY